MSTATWHGQPGHDSELMNDCKTASAGREGLDHGTYDMGCPEGGSVDAHQQHQCIRSHGNGANFPLIHACSQRHSGLEDEMVLLLAGGAGEGGEVSMWQG